MSATELAALTAIRNLRMLPLPLEVLPHGHGSSNDLSRQYSSLSLKGSPTREQIEQFHQIGMHSTSSSPHTPFDFSDGGGGLPLGSENQDLIDMLSLSRSVDPMDREAAMFKQRSDSLCSEGMASAIDEMLNEANLSKTFGRFQNS